MNPEDKNKIEKLKEQIQCDKEFKCTGTDLDNLCQAAFHLKSDELECLEEKGACSFAENTSSVPICTCPLRKFIAENLAIWTSVAYELNDND